MYKIQVNGETRGLATSLDGAFTVRNDIARNILQELYENDEIDKYAIEDWTFGLKENEDPQFYIDEGPGFQITIV